MSSTLAPECSLPQPAAFGHACDRLGLLTTYAMGVSPLRLFPGRSKKLAIFSLIGVLLLQIWLWRLTSRPTAEEVSSGGGVAHQVDAWPRSPLSGLRNWASVQPLAFIGVQTSFNYYSFRRSDLRKTWFPGDWDAMKKIESQYGFVMRFVIGQTDNPEAEMSLQEEIEEFGPMLRLPIKDTYTGLPWKTHSFVVTVYRLYNPKFIVKVDDDLYVRLDRLRLALEYYEERQFGFIGCMRTGMIVSDPKEMNYEPDHAVIGGREYHTFASGPLYILSNSAGKLLSAIEPASLRHLANEDTMMGAWMVALNVKHFDDQRLCSATCIPVTVGTVPTHVSQLSTVSEYHRLCHSSPTIPPGFSQLPLMAPRITFDAEDVKGMPIFRASLVVRMSAPYYKGDEVGEGQQRADRTGRATKRVHRGKSAEAHWDGDPRESAEEQHEQQEREHVDDAAEGHFADAGGWNAAKLYKQLRQGGGVERQREQEHRGHVDAAAQEGYRSDVHSQVPAQMYKGLNPQHMKQQQQRPLDEKSRDKVAGEGRFNGAEEKVDKYKELKQQFMKRQQQRLGGRIDEMADGHTDDADGHSAADLYWRQKSWRCLVDSAPSTRTEHAEAGGTVALSCPTELQVSARCYAPTPFEQFNGGFDLQNSTIEIGGDSLQWCVLPGAGKTSPPGEVAQLTLGDDDGVLIPLGTFDFAIAGERFSEVCLSSNGCFTFGPTCAPELNDDPATMTAIAVVMTDLDPSSGGNVTYWEVPGGRLVVRFLEVPLRDAPSQVLADLSMGATC
eukprot:jgi/Tetstr1/434259/TSEL_023366.t1